MFVPGATHVAEAKQGSEVMEDLTERVSDVRNM